MSDSDPFGVVKERQKNYKDHTGGSNHEAGAREAYGSQYDDPKKFTQVVNGARSVPQVETQEIKLANGQIVEGVVMQQGKNAPNVYLGKDGQPSRILSGDEKNPHGYLERPDGSRVAIASRETVNPFSGLDVKSAERATQPKPFIDPHPTGEYKAITNNSAESPTISNSANRFNSAISPDSGSKSESSPVSTSNKFSNPVAAFSQALGEIVKKSSGTQFENRTEDLVRTREAKTASAELRPNATAADLMKERVDTNSGAEMVRTGKLVVGNESVKVTEKGTSLVGVDPTKEVKDVGNRVKVEDVRVPREVAPAAVQRESLVGQRERVGIEVGTMDARRGFADPANGDTVLKSAAKVGGENSQGIKGGGERVAAPSEKVVQVPEKIVDERRGGAKNSPLGGERLSDREGSRREVVRGQNGGANGGTSMDVTGSKANSKKESTGQERTNRGEKTNRDDKSSRDERANRDERSNRGEKVVRAEGEYGQSDRRQGRRDGDKNSAGSKAPVEVGGKAPVEGGKVAPKLDIALSVKLADPQIKARVIDVLRELELGKIVAGAERAGKRLVAFANEVGVENIKALREMISRSEVGKPPRLNGVDDATMDGYRRILKIVVNQVQDNDPVGKNAFNEIQIKNERRVETGAAVQRPYDSFVRNEKVQDAVVTIIANMGAVVRNTEKVFEIGKQTKRIEDGSTKVQDRKWEVRDGEGLTMAERRLAFVMGLLGGIGFGGAKHRAENNTRTELREWNAFWNGDKDAKKDGKETGVRADRTRVEESAEDSEFRSLYTVRKGDTLRSIALKHPLLGNVRLWELIAQINQLPTRLDTTGRPAFVLHVGERIQIPSQDDVIIFWAEKWLLDRKETEKRARVCCLMCKKAVAGGDTRCRRCDWSSNVSSNLIDTVLNVMEPQVLRKWVR